MDHLVHNLGWRREIGVKDGDEFARGALHTLGERPGLKPFAIRAVMIGDRDSRRSSTH